MGQRNIEEIDRVVRGGNYGWAVKEGDFLFNRKGRRTRSVGPQPGSPADLIDPISGPKGTLQYDHGDGISITGGFVYRGSAIPELYGKYVFGDLALRNVPPRVDGRLFYADLQSGEILEFLLPQFANGVLPDGLTVHGFGQDASGGAVRHGHEHAGQRDRRPRLPDRQRAASRAAISCSPSGRSGCSAMPGAGASSGS